MKGPDLRALLVPVVLGLAVGAVGGWLWWTWWGPPPIGKVYETPAGPTWYPDPFDPGVTRDFTGTAIFVVVGFGLALVLGILSGWVARNRAVQGLAAVVVASVAAAAVMTAIGLWQSPADPQGLVDEVKIGAELSGNLEVGGWTPYLAWPVGALLGYLVLMLSVTSEWRRPEQPSAAPAHQA